MSLGWWGSMVEEYIREIVYRCCLLGSRFRLVFRYIRGGVSVRM